MSKSKKKAVLPAETNEQKPAEAEPVVTSAPPPIGQDGRPVALAVQSDAAKPSEPVKSDVISIVDVIKGLPEDKVAMAENLGVPVRPILKWMYQTEQTQNQIIEFLKKLGANMQQAQASGNLPVGTAQGNSPNPIGMALQYLPQILGGGGADPWTEKFKEVIMEAGLRSFTLTSRIGEGVLNSTYKQWIPQMVADKEPPTKPPS